MGTGRRAVAEKPLKLDSCELHLEKLGLDGLFNDMTADEAAERTENMISQINLLWGIMLYVFYRRI